VNLGLVLEPSQVICGVRSGQIVPRYTVTAGVCSCWMDIRFVYYLGSDSNWVLCDIHLDDLDISCVEAAVVQWR